MSVRTVAWKDFTTASRSRGLWAVATLLALLFAVVAFGFSGYALSATETVKQLFRTLSMVLAMLLPIVALVASYMAIAGERESGGIKFYLSLPNTRREVFLGKLASRLLVFAGGVAFVFLATAAVVVSRHGVLPAGVVLGMFALSLLYGSVFVAVAVALSASVAARSRAIAAAVGSYFVLVVLYAMPGIRISSLVRWAHTTMLGMDANPDLYSAVTYTSPYIAFRKATNLVFGPSMETEIFRRGADAGGDLPVYLSDEFSLVVLSAWLVLPLVVGYLRFEGADLE